ncbi:unnamed protein product [Camellia sinensis]
MLFFPQDGPVLKTGTGQNPQNTQRTVAIVVGGVAGFGLGIACLLFLKSAFKKRENKILHDVNGIIKPSSLLVTVKEFGMYGKWEMGDEINSREVLKLWNSTRINEHTEKVKLHSILATLSEFEHAEKGDALYESQLLPKLDDFMRCHLSNWDNTLIDIQQKTKEMAFLSSLNQIASIEWESMSGEFMPEFFKLVLGTLSLPINFPGTNYHRGFQAQENIVSMLRRLVEERRACQETKHDMLGLLMNEGEENRYNLTDEEKIDQTIAILYSGYETVM